MAKQETVKKFAFLYKTKQFFFFSI